MHRDDALALLALAVGATAYLWPVVGGGEILAGGDIVNQYLPYRHVTREAVAAGDWPWWNPWSFGGVSLAANLNAHLFYPPSLFSFALPLERYFGWAVWLHVIWGLAGTYLFQRRVGLGVFGSLLGAAVFWVSGFFIFNLQAGIMLFHQSVAWWPWAMLGALAWCQTGRRPWIALAGASLAMMFLAGAPQLFLYAAGTLALMTLTLALGHAEWRGRLLGLGVIVLLTALLIQIQFLPAREFTARSQRATLTADEAWSLNTGDSLAPRSLLLALMPTMCGDPSNDPEYFGTAQGIHEVVPAVMTPALLMALIGLIAWGRRSAEAEGDHRTRWVMFHLVLGLLALVAAFGPHTPLFRFLWLTVPGFQEFRVPARFSLIALWCLACLVAVVADGLWRLAGKSATEERGRVVWNWSGWCILVVGAVGGVASLFIDMRTLLIAIGMPPEAARELPPGGTLEEMTRAHLEFFPEIVTQSKTALVTWCAALALTGLGIALMTSGRRLWIPGLAVLLAAFSLTAPPRSMIVTAPADAVETQIYPASETVEVIRENLNGGRLLCLDSVYHFLYSRQHLELYPNRPLMRGIPDVRGYDPMIPAAHTRVMNAVAGLNLDTPAHGRLAMPQPIRWELLRMLNVTVVASLRPVEDDALALLWQGPNGMHLYRVREPGAPGRFASGFAVATGDPAIDLAVVAGGALDQFDPTHQVLLESETISLRGMMDMVASGSVTLIERGFDHLTYEVTAKSEGHLVTDVTFDPGWRAEVNGLPADTLIGDTRFLTVWVPQGTSRVEFTCWPKSLRHGALLTLAGVLLAALLCLPRRRSEEIGREKESPGA